MRLNTVLDAIYILNSVWSSSGPQVCPASPPVFPRTTIETSWLPRPHTPAVIITFIDVNVVPMDTERVLANHTVLVEDGRITALGPTGQVPVPAAAVRIDGRGRYLMPGLADMHMHISSFTEAKIQGVLQDKLFDLLASGVTTVRHLQQVWSKVATVARPEGTDISPQQMRRYFETAEVPIPRIYLSPSFSKSISLGNVAAHVAAAKAAGYTHISMPFMSANEYRARDERMVAFVDSLLAAGRRVGLPVAMHNHVLSFNEALALGATGGSVEHLYLYWKSIGFTLGSPDPNAGAPADVPLSKIQALVAATQRAGLWITPTLLCSEGLYSSPTHLKVMRQFIKALQEAGVGLLLGTDAQTAHEELTALVRAGLTPYQALRTGTRNVAQFLGVLDSAGTVAVGKRADLVLLGGNPLEDIEHTRAPAGVMIGGRWLDRAALDRHRAALGQRQGRGTP